MKLFKTLIHTFRPSVYDEITDHSFKQTGTYFLKLFSFAFLIMCIFAIPLLLNVRNTLHNQMDGFEKFVVTTDFKQIKPIHIGEWLTIDLQANETAQENSVFITEQTITLKKMFFEKTLHLTGLSDVTAHKEEYVVTLFTLFLLLLPSILIITYLWYVLKFILFIFAVSFIALIIARISRFEISFKIILHSALFASGSAIFLELITRPLTITVAPLQIEWIGYAVSLIIFILAIKEQGYWDKKTGIKPRKKGYIEYE